METSAKKFCESCGKPLLPDARFCEECGQLVAAAPEPLPAAPAPAPVVLTNVPPVPVAAARPVAAPAYAAPTYAAPPIAAPAMAPLPGAEVRAGRGAKGILGVLGGLVLMASAFFYSPAGKQLLARFSNKSPAATPAQTAAPAQPKAPGRPTPPDSAPLGDVALAPPRVTPPAPTAEVTAQKWIDAGFAKEQAGDVTAALADYQKALDLTSDRKLAAHMAAIRESLAAPPPPQRPPVTKAAAAAAPSFHFVGNKLAVANGATRDNTFEISEPMLITYISTYHWNNGKGKTPGLIALLHKDGTKYGDWQAEGINGQGGVPNASWLVYPNVVIKAGTYTVLDSNPTTWSQNQATGGQGMCEIKGVPAGQ